MRTRGLEPPRALAHQDLNLARLPIPPRPRGTSVTMRIARIDGLPRAAGFAFMLAAMETVTARPGYELWRPNREKAESKTMKALIAFVLLISAALLIIVTIGGWERLLGASVGAMSLIWAGLYILFAFLVMRWNRGILPVAAALAVILAIFAAIAAPDWFARSKDGLDSPALPEDLLGLLTVDPGPGAADPDRRRDDRLQPGVARRGGAADRRPPASRRGRRRAAPRPRPPETRRPIRTAPAAPGAARSASGRPRARR